MSQANAHEVSGAELLKMHDAYAHHRDALALEGALHNRPTDVALEVPRAVMTMLATIEGVRPFRADVIRLPTLDVAAFDEIESLGRALYYADLRLARALFPARAMALLVCEAAELRALLVADCAKLVAHGLVPSDSLHGLHWLPEAADLAADLTQLACLVREHRQALGEHAACDLVRLAHADQVADELVHMLHERAVNLDEVTKRRAERDAARRLFVHAYGEGRAGLVFLRWNECDADVIMPPLWDDPGVGQHSELGPASAARPKAAANAQEAPPHKRDDDPSKKPN